MPDVFTRYTIRFGIGWNAPVPHSVCLRPFLLPSILHVTWLSSKVDPSLPAYKPSLPLSGGALGMPRCYKVTTLSISDTVLQTFLKMKVKSSSSMYKSHLEITLKYHIQVCKEKANVILITSEFIQLLKSQDTSPGLNFF